MMSNNIQPALATSVLTISMAIGSALLVGCGGSSGGTAGDGGNNSASVLSGVAATGAAIVGTVQVTDVNLKQKSVNTASDGSYRIDVGDMKAPFVLLAKGKLGSGKEVSYYAPATAEDIGKNLVNITPLSDLMLANIAGDLAANCAASASCVSALSKAKVDTAVADLAVKLAPVLKEIGLDASTDLLHAKFTAGTSQGVDALLDVLNVSIDTASKIATIKNLVSGTSVTDDVTQSADNKTAIPAAVNGTVTPPVSLVAQANARWAEMVAISSSGKTKAEKFALLKSFCSADFKFQGSTDCAAFMQETPSAMPALERIGAFDLAGVDSIDPKKVMTDQTIGMVLKDAERITFLWKKGSDGKLYFAGDQRISQAYVGSIRQSSPSGFDSALTVDVRPGKNSDGSLQADSAVLTGPGLPETGVAFTPDSNSDYFKRSLGSSNTIQYAELVDPERVVNDAVYTLTLKKDTAVVATYRTALVNALTNPSTLTANMFPQVSNLPGLSLCTQGGSWTPAYTLPAGYTLQSLWMSCTGGMSSATQANLYYTEGAKTTDAVTLPAKADSTFISVGYGAYDSQGKRFEVNYGSNK